MDKGVETPEAKVFRDLNRGVIPAMPCVARGSKPVSPNTQGEDRRRGPGLQRDGGKTTNGQGDC
eukprot:7675382-Heterocapsa_arctica.AAC.1